jgi:hypothetical protein
MVLGAYTALKLGGLAANVALAAKSAAAAAGAAAAVV